MFISFWSSDIQQSVQKQLFSSLQEDLRKETDVLAALISQNPTLMNKSEEIASRFEQVIA